METLWMTALTTAMLHALVVTRWALGWRRAMKNIREPRPLPSGSVPLFTVVIPCRNESANLERLLSELQAMQATLPFSVVVVDDHSTDHTAAVAREHASAPRLLALPDTDFGKKSALLLAMKSVTTPWALTIDADVTLPPLWAQTWHRLLMKTTSKTAAVAGPVIMSDGSTTWWNEIQTLDFASQMGWAGSQIAFGHPASCSGANLAIRPDDYPDTRNMGPSGDDALVIQSLAKQGRGVDMCWDPQLAVETPGAATIQEWTHQRMRWAGKMAHYHGRAQATALWMGWVAVMQMVLLMAMLKEPAQAALLSLGFWGVISGMHIAFARLVMRRLGRRASWLSWLMLAWTQPFQAPWLMLAKTGLLQFWGIASTARWKGRTCAA